MSRACWLFMTFIIAVATVGCGMSKEEISQTVKTSMQSKFNTDPQFKNLHFTVTDVQVLSKGGNLYTGIAKVSYKEFLHDVAVDITVDGNQVMWQAPPGAFGFILGDELRKLQDAPQ